MAMVFDFPNLRPRAVNRFWLNDPYENEEAQTLQYEREHQIWRDSIKNIAADIQPIGMILTIPEVDIGNKNGNDDIQDPGTNDWGPSDFYSMPEDGYLDIEERIL